MNSELARLGDVPHAVRHWRVAGAKDVVLLLHGIESHSGWFVATATELALAGFAVFAFDRAGWGESPGTRGDLTAAGAIAEVLAARAMLGATYERVHLAGLSWGGLLAAAVREAAPAAFASVSLIVPAFFPRRRPGPFALARALLGFGGPVALPIDVKDFTKAPSARDYIARDPHRVTAVTPRTLRATVQLAATVRRRFHRGAGPAASVLIAETDALIDGARTAAFAAARGAAVHHFPGTVHSLVLEDPHGVAVRIVETARRGGAPSPAIVPHAS